MKKTIIFSLVIRLLCLYLFRNVINYDLESYFQVGNLTLNGVNIYPEIANLHHPYFPLFLYFEAFSAWLGRSKMEVIIILKFINVLFDIGILYLLYLLSKQNIKTAVIYALNPVTVLITTLHGQFDVIPLFFLLLTLYLIKIKKQTLAVIMFSFAITVKTWPLLFITSIFTRLKNIKLIFNIVLFPVLSMIIYSIIFKTSIINIIKTLSGYQGLWGIWGPMGLISQISPIGPIGQKITTAIFLFIFFAFAFFKKNKNSINEILNHFFFFFVFTTNFSIQYFAWIIPFLILIKPKKYLNLIFLISIYLLTFYFVWLFNFKNENVLFLYKITQNLIGSILWVSFIRTWYLSSK